MSSTRKRRPALGRAANVWHICNIVAACSVCFLLQLGQTGAQRTGNAGRNDCFKLSKSRTCPEFSDFSVKAVNDFKNVEEFDSFVLRSHASSNSFRQEFASAFGCSMEAPDFQRYHRSFMCSYFITQGGCVENIKVKNSGRQIICKKQCDQFIESTRALFRDSTKCTSTPTDAQATARSESVAAESEFSLFCKLIPDNLDYKSNQCSRGLRDEFKQCGFISTRMAQSFCSKSPASESDCCVEFGKSAESDNDKDYVFKLGKVKFTKKILIIVGASIGGAVLLSSLIAFIAIMNRRRRLRRIESSINSLNIGNDNRSSNEPEISGPLSRDIAADNADIRLKAYMNETKGLSQYEPGGGNSPPGETLLAQTQDAGALGYAASKYPSRSAGKLNNNEYTTGLTYVSAAPPNADMRNSTMSFQGSTPLADNARNMVRVIRPYTAELSDELTLVVGDVIVIDEVFDDDWAVGKNEATGEVGMFPMVCAEPLNSKQDTAPRPSDRKISNRGNSLVYSANIGL